MSASNSEADAQILQEFGLFLMQEAVGDVAQTAMCSVYGTVFAVAVYSIFRRGLKSRSSIIMLCVVVSLYAVSVTGWAIGFATRLGNIHTLLMIPEISIPEREGAGNALIKRFGVANEVIFFFNMIVGDGVVIWRTWAVYQGRLLAIAIPSTLLLMSFVFALIDLTCAAYLGPLPGAEQICPPSSMIAWVFSVATNAACTILIFVRARQHRRIVRELNMPRQTRRMSAENILSLLVESGFIYTLLWLTQIIGYLPIYRDSPWFFLWFVIDPIINAGSLNTGMYPTLIIVIVNFKRTIWEDSPTTPSNALGSLHLVVNTTRSGRIDTVVSPRRVDWETVIDITQQDSKADQKDKQPSEHV
ncbi:hypothetical protein K438DRAFT_1970785 [Mycena galopus ATCC 62051]|nr:hypothetical protein K438DRAFT_1970785 [Mycena galopus ATCC 62051]